MDSLDFIRWFRSAGAYINAHRGRVFVISFSGSVVQSPSFSSLIEDLALLNSLGIRLILVHGSKPQIDDCLGRQGMDFEVINRVRVTRAEHLECVKQASGQVRMEVEAKLSMAMPNTPMSGAKITVVSGNFVTARPYGIRGGVDFAHTGEVRKVNTDAIAQALSHSQIVLLSNTAYSPTGEIFNIPAELIAAETAKAIKADKLIYVMAGEMEAKACKFDPEEARERLGDPADDSEFEYHLRHGLMAVEGGVKRAHIVSHEDGALLAELFTRDGSGALLTAEKYETLRMARIEDVGGILALIEPLEKQQVLVKRSREQLELEIDRYLVVERDGMIIASGALHVFEQDGVAELAALAVHADYRRQGHGDRLLEKASRMARKQGCSRLFVLTTHTTHWFIERGFRIGQISELPVARQNLYNWQRNSQILIKDL